jgi:hypothetical protein
LAENPGQNNSDHNLRPGQEDGGIVHLDAAGQDGLVEENQQQGRRKVKCDRRNHQEVFALVLLLFTHL